MNRFPGCMNPSSGVRAVTLGLALLFGLSGGIGSVANAQTPSQGSVSSHCGPYPTPVADPGAAQTRVQLAQLDASDLEVRPSPRGVRGSASKTDPGQGNIVSLPTEAADAEATNPTATAGSSSGTQESEALLALPKDASGAIADDFVLGPGARVSESFFSPVICSTVARVKGPAGATPAQLVVNVPDGAIVVANDTYYASAAAEVRTFEKRVGSEPDPYESLQYGLAVTGVRYARDLGDGAGIRVALLDSAPEATHDDLVGIRVEPISAAAAESLGVGVHGTLMAGVISAVEGNGYGIAGVAPGADLLSIPICQPDGGAGGRCSVYHMLRGLDLAWEGEAQIVNLSLSGPPNPLLERGVARLDELGVVVVAAAGNEGVETPRFPAAYPTVIGVGAVDREGRVFDQSNRGEWVELVAPGVEVLSTVPGNAFAFGSGTSLAAAHVTGVLAVLSEHTGDPKAAKAELFRAAHSRPRSPGRSPGAAPILPEICSVFTRLGRPCEGRDPDGR